MSINVGQGEYTFLCFISRDAKEDELFFLKGFSGCHVKAIYSFCSRTPITP